MTRKPNNCRRGNCKAQLRWSVTCAFNLCKLSDILENFGIAQVRQVPQPGKKASGVISRLLALAAVFTRFHSWSISLGSVLPPLVYSRMKWQERCRIGKCFPSAACAEDDTRFDTAKPGKHETPIPETCEKLVSISEMFRRFFQTPNWISNLVTELSRSQTCIRILFQTPTSFWSGKETSLAFLFMCSGMPISLSGRFRSFPWSRWWQGAGRDHSGLLRT